MIFSIAGEGPTDIAVANRLLEATGHSLYQPFPQGGKHQLDSRLPGYNNSAKHGRPWLVLRDLDHDADCAPSLVAARLPQQESLMIFRVVVRALEAWLIADSAGMAQFLGVSEALFPTDADQVADPKALLLRIGARSSKAPAMLPKPGVNAKVGTGYGAELRVFIASHWSIDRAAEYSDSLRRCVAALRRL